MIRPTAEDLEEIACRVDRAESKNAIHTARTCIACMRGLIKSPYWAKTEQANWDYYRRSIDEALAHDKKPILIP